MTCTDEHLLTCKLVQSTASNCAGNQHQQTTGRLMTCKEWLVDCCNVCSKIGYSASAAQALWLYVVVCICVCSKFPIGTSKSQAIKHLAHTHTGTLAVVTFDAITPTNNCLTVDFVSAAVAKGGAVAIL